MRIVNCMFGLMLFFVALPSWASDAVELTSGTFERQREAVMQDLAEGTKYSEIPEKEKLTVVTLLGRMSSLISRAPSVEELHDSDRAQLFNDQEQVNTILTRARADSRVVCRREAPVGTRRAQTRCLTVAERRLATETSQDQLRRSGVMRSMKSN